MIVFYVYILPVLFDSIYDDLIGFAPPLHAQTGEEAGNKTPNFAAGKR